MVVTREAVRGVIAALVTPYKSHGGVDAEGLARLVEHVVAGGVHGVLVAGSVGEFVHLSRGERLLVTQTAVAAAADRVPVYAGTSAESTEETIALTRDAAKGGADAAVVVAPYYFRLPQDALARHYAEVTAAGGLPVLVDNSPALTGNALTPATLAGLGEVEGIVGLTQSDRDLGQLVEAVHLSGERCPVLTGSDAQAYPALCVGARGVVSAAAGVMPREMVALYDAYQAGDHEAARACYLRAHTFGHFLAHDAETSGYCKAALALLGLPAGPVRRPLPDLPDAARAGVRAALVALGLL